MNGVKGKDGEIRNFKRPSSNSIFLPNSPSLTYYRSINMGKVQVTTQSVHLNSSSGDKV